MRAAGLVLLGSSLLAACTGEPPRAVVPSQPIEAAEPAVPPTFAPPARPEPARVIGARVASFAKGFVGTPYRYGGDSPSGFDCSGLVYFVYREVGLSVPRTAAEQRAAVRRVPVESLEPGDLVFFYTPEDHVGIYLGGGEFVHAPATGRRVERARLDSPYFILGFAGGGRFTAP